MGPHISSEPAVSEVLMLALCCKYLTLAMVCVWCVLDGQRGQHAFLDKINHFGTLAAVALSHGRTLCPRQNGLLTIGFITFARSRDVQFEKDLTVAPLQKESQQSIQTCIIFICCFVIKPFAQA